MKKLFTFLFLFSLTLGYSQELTQVKTDKYSVYFDFDKSKLTDEENKRLNDYVKSLGDIVILSIGLEGFCDDRGSIEYNRGLSQRRAKTVSDILQEIASKQKNVEGKGKIDLRITELQLSDDELDATRQLNRRVDIYLEYFHNDFIDLSKPKDSLPSKIQVENRQLRLKTFEEKPLKVGDIIKLKDLYFEGGRAVLLRKSEKQLDKLLNELKNNPNFKFQIQGHVCCIDTEYFRDAVDEDTGINNLSEARAKAIFAYLKANGIPEERMSYKGFGRDYPLEGEKERNNKRVEICITSID
ncbi:MULTISPECIES: OmpA family protein [Flavobacterium]|uniref:OmpA family protein n=1 Tax=Flavobacterium TaxID=237 RepID=UPI001FCC1684|nr:MULTISPECIES: OmpA family protein [Flavobacterium]UOK43116.1 OmpA family protein [Flavobacterium enshiense]